MTHSYVQLQIPGPDSLLYLRRLPESGDNHWQATAICCCVDVDTYYVRVDAEEVAQNDYKLSWRSR